MFCLLDSNGVVPTGQLRLLNGFDVNAMTVVFSVLTNLGIGNVTVSGGGNVSAPFLTAHAESAGCVGTVWKSIGAGSILNFSAITNLTGADCGALTIQAVLGGTVQLSGVVSIGEGSIAMVADGAGSLIQLSSLAESESLVRNVSFEARNSGTVAMPAFEGGETVIITIRSGGALDTAQLKLLKSLTVSATTVSIPGITNLFAGSLIVEAGAVLNLPNLTNHNQGSSCAASSWTADGAGSVLNLPGLKRLTGGTCVPLKIQALNSGQAVLSGLTHVPAGRVQIIASGSGSLVNLLSLSNLVSHPLVSELIVTNNGAAQLNREGLVFDGVNIRTLTSNGAPPPVNLTNASRVVLFGRPWRSYWVETRRTTSPTNVWTFFQRVPLTNDFQTIVPQGVADTEFSAREFVADPPWFDISVPAGTNIQLILFAATNHGYDLENATNLTSAAWGSLGTVTMTNTFRILDPVPNQKPAQFFRSKTL
ncbi:MAG: hypothetical protein U1F65_07240 [Verrucomicrobiota bacterium]